MTNNLTAIGYLGRALSFELSAVQQYLALSRLLEMRGMKEAAQRFKQESQEEMEHAERIIARMIALGFAPNASCLRPARLDGSMIDLMQHAAQLEHEIVSLYSQAVRFCIEAQDHENRIFFEALLKEEQHHAAEIESWRNQLITGQAQA